MRKRVTAKLETGAGRLALLSALALGFAGCADRSDVVAPNARLQSDIILMPTTAVIYSNFGPNMSFDSDPFHGWSIYGFLPPPTTGQQAISQRFTPAADYRFRDAQVPLVLFSVASNIRVLLQADAEGLPGAVVEEMSVAAPGPTPVIVTASSVLFPMLHGGTPYWLTLMPESGVLAGWNWNSIGDVSSEPVLTMATTQTGDPAGPWIPVPLKRTAFQIDGTPATPQDAIQVLMADVRSLVSEGVLKPGQRDGLLAKLAAAIPSLDGGRTNAACNQLQAFVNQVSGLVGAKKLSAAAGQELTDAAVAIRSQVGCPSALCPAPAQGNSVLVDASRDGGVWWSPQAGPFSPESEHQGQALADYLRGKGYAVEELARGITITDSVLLASKIVIRANVFGSYTSAELQAYQHFLACPRTLLLLGDYISDGNQDQLAEMLGVKFTGNVSGFVTEFAAHPITSGVVPLFYNAGAVVDAGYPNTVHILGWLSTGEPVMGVVDHGAAKVFFIGDTNGIESVPQPLVDNLVNWGF